MIGLLAKMRLKVYAKIRFGYFLVLRLALVGYVDRFFYLMLLYDFKSIKTEVYSKKLCKNMKNLSVTIVYFFYGHT